MPTEEREAFLAKERARARRMLAQAEAADEKRKALEKKRKLQEKQRREEEQRAETERLVIPSLKLAEERVLGFCMAQNVMLMMKKLFEKHYRTTTRGTAKLDVKFEPTVVDEVNDKLKKQLVALIEEAKMKHGCEFVHRNSRGAEIALPTKLDFRMDLCEVFVIPDSDPRVELRGQRGLRAKRYIDIHTVLGMYNGLILSDYAANLNLCNNPRKDWPGTVEEWRHQVRRLLITTNREEVFNEASNRKETIPLTISPFGFHSIGSLINDPRILPEDPIAGLADGTEPLFPNNRRKLEIKTDIANVDVGAALICDFPFLVMYTKAPMLEAQELLYDYGDHHFTYADQFVTDRV